MVVTKDNKFLILVCSEEIGVTCNLAAANTLSLQLYSPIKSLYKTFLCDWLLFLKRNETAEQEDFYARGSTTAEWRAGEQAAASFQPAGSSRQDKASLFKTPPTPQRK